MLFTTIDRYIFKELLKVFTISVGALTAVLFLDKFLFMAEMIISRGVTLAELVLIITYISPAFLALSIPMSVLIASVSVFNQFSAFNEYIAMKASALSYMDLVKPVAFFSIFAYFLANVVMFIALPWGNLSYKKLIFDIIQNRASFDIKAQVFNKDFKNLILIVKDKKHYNITDIFLADLTDKNAPKIITARTGEIHPNPATLKILLKLSDGAIHTNQKERNEYETLNFDRYDLTLSLPDPKRLKEEALVGNRELSLSQIQERIKQMEADGLSSWGPKVELSKKFSIPFACLLFGLLGPPLGIKSSRSGKSGGFAISVGIILLYYIGLISTQNLGRAGEINPYLSVWIPNLILIVVVSFLTYKMQKEIPFTFLEKIVGWLESVFKLLKSTFKAILSRFPNSAPKTQPQYRRNQQALDKTTQEYLEEKLKNLRPK
ncbi:MAG: YjgP/YjgQ family permease [Candidatus Nitrohelix vancouverensis]|uniref:YjgP/YjgQ family permease n=1 Tax=Candidatus Nitrohelix vancouverensis TaxID=2705534 RepID=A0A7T0C3R1_9BACT|nr:MAG: YjgP/YjgQ family permease [Candidatus Nitrohelix vancouverensis]